MGRVRVKIPRPDICNEIRLFEIRNQQIYEVLFNGKRFWSTPRIAGPYSANAGPVRADG